MTRVIVVTIYRAPVILHNGKVWEFAQVAKFEAPTFHRGHGRAV